jgi:hypothetical protein
MRPPSSTPGGSPGYAADMLWGDANATNMLYGEIIGFDIRPLKVTHVCTQSHTYAHTHKHTHTHTHTHKHTRTQVYVSDCFMPQDTVPEGTPEGLVMLPERPSFLKPTLLVRPSQPSFVPPRSW